MISSSICNDLASFLGSWLSFALRPLSSSSGAFRGQVSFSRVMSVTKPNGTSSSLCWASSKLHRKSPLSPALSIALFATLNLDCFGEPFLVLNCIRILINVFAVCKLIIVSFCLVNNGFVNETFLFLRNQFVLYLTFIVHC